jgi:hypothetical protein
MATITRIDQSKAISHQDEYYGRFTFHFNDYIDITLQITSKSKLSITYPENIDYHDTLERVKPFLVKADNTPIKLLKEYMLTDFKKEKTKSFMDNSNFYSKRRHTKDLKKYVIKPWLESLDILIPEIPFKEEAALEPPQKLTIDQGLFEDLKLHVDVEAFFLYDELNNELLQISQKRNETLEKIEGNIKEIFINLGLELSDKWRPPCINRRLVGLIFNLAYYWETNKKMYEIQRENIEKSYMEKDGYYIVGTGYFSLIDVSEPDKLKKNIDAKIQGLLENIEKSIYSQDTKPIFEAHSHATKIREKLKVILKKYLHTPILPNSCEFIKDFED